jgi:hypothetical protein
VKPALAALVVGLAGALWGYCLGRDRYARPCVCEHARAAHQHDRGGLDCSLCLCNRYRRA